MTQGFREQLLKEIETEQDLDIGELKNKLEVIGEEAAIQKITEKYGLDDEDIVEKLEDRIEVEADILLPTKEETLEK